MSRIKSKVSKMVKFFQSAMVVLIASLFVMSVVYAATTIGTNITTGGTIEASGTHASTTGFMVIGTALGDISPSAGDLFISGNATTAGALIVGTAVPETELSAGDIFNSGNTTSSGNLSIGGFASTTGYLKVGGGVFDLSTGTAATTTQGIFSRDRTTSTSTVSIGDAPGGSGEEIVGCLEMTASDGNYYQCFINVATPSLVCVIGRCN